MNTFRMKAVTFCVALFTVLFLVAICVGMTPITRSDSARTVATATDTNTNYVQGSDIGRTPAGTQSVSTAADFVSKINANATFQLTADIELDSSVSNAKPFSHNATFSGKIYGNGHTVTIRYRSSTPDASRAENTGGIVSVLSGAIYDLNVVVPDSTTIKFARNASPSTFNMGIIAGTINGGTVENCTVTIGRLSEIWACAWRSSDWASFGAIAGRVQNKATVRYCTVTNNGTIKSGAASDGSVSGIHTTSSASGAASNLFGYIEAGDFTADAIVVSGSGSIESFYASNLGMTASASSHVNTSGFYNRFSGSFTSANNGKNWHYTRNISKGSFGSYEYVGEVNVKNVYRSNNSNQVSGEDVIQPQNKIVVILDNQNVYFDPTATDVAQCLTVKESVAKPDSGITQTVSLVSGGTPKVTKQADAMIDNGSNNTVLFRRMSAETTSWSANVNFTYTIDIEEQLPNVPPLADLTEYEHGYIASDYVPSGTPISTAQDFYRMLSNHSAGESYYLANDITIKGLSNVDFAATLDGNGKTIYVAAAQSSLSGNQIGAVFGAVSGTVRNLRVSVSSTLQVNTGAGGPMYVGALAGVLKTGSLVENVNVTISSENSITVQHTDRTAIGGLAGGIVGGGAVTIRNVTVQLDGYLRVGGTYTFAGGLIGYINSGDEGSNYQILAENTIFRGQGTLWMEASNQDSKEQGFFSMLGVLAGNQNSKYTVNNAIQAYRGTLRVKEGASVSMFGILAKNYANNASLPWSVEKSAIFRYQGAQGDQKLSGGYAHNAPIDMQTVEIASSVSDHASIAVQAYFVPKQANTLVLIAGNSSTQWGDIASLQVISAGGTPILSSNTANGKRIYVPTDQVEKDVDTVTVYPFYAVDAPVVSGSYVYNGVAQEIALQTMYYHGTSLTTSDYTVRFAVDDSVPNNAAQLDESGKPLTAGQYLLTVELLQEQHFFAGEDTPVKQATIQLTVGKAQAAFVDEVSANAVYGVYQVSGDAYDIVGWTEEFFTADFALLAGKDYTARVTQTDGKAPVSSAAGYLSAGEYILHVALNGNLFEGELTRDYTFRILPKELSFTLEIQADWKNAVYDGSQRTIAQQPVAEGILASDQVTGVLTYTYDGEAVEAIEHAGAYRIGLELSGSDASNYTVAQFRMTYAGGETVAEDTITVAKASNGWMREYSRDGWTYGQTPAEEVLPQAQFGQANVLYFRDGAPYTGGFDTDTAVGVYTVQVDVPATADYEGLHAEYSFEIVQQTIVIVGSGAEAVYDASAYDGELTLQITPDVSQELLGAITWQYRAVGSDVWTDGLPVDAGEYELRVASVSDPNYAVQDPEVYGKVTIDKLSVQFDWQFVDGARVTFGDRAEALQDLVQMPQSAITQIYHDIAFSLQISGYEIGTHAGEQVTFTVSGAFDEAVAHNYMLEPVSKTLTVQPAMPNLARQEIHVSVLGEDYPNYARDAIVQTLQAAGLLSTADATALEYDVDLTGVQFDESGAVRAGEHAITLIPHDTDYASVQILLIVTDKKGVLTVTVELESDTYSGQEVPFTFSVQDQNGQLPADVILGDTLQVKIYIDDVAVSGVLHAGVYDLRAEFSGASTGEYQIVLGNTRVELQKLTVTSSAGEIETATYGDVYVQGNRVIGLPQDWLTALGEQVEYELVLERADGNLDTEELYVISFLLDREKYPDYDVAGLQVNLLVSHKKIFVGFEPSATEYNGEVVTLHPILREEIEAGDDVALSIVADREVRQAGSYRLRVEASGEDAKNYMFELETDTFTLKAAQAQIVWDNESVSESGEIIIQQGSAWSIEDWIASICDASGQSVDMSKVRYELAVTPAPQDPSAWAPGEYEVTISLYGNYEATATIRVVIQAQQVPDGGSFPSWAIALCVVAGIAVIGGVVALILVRRKKQQA